MTRCKVCESPTAPLARAIVLGKHDVQYYRCPGCGFTQVEDPYWLDEAYSDAIARSDVGIVRRNLIFCDTTRALISAFFDASASFVDYGAGYGLFVRLMRDAGFDFRWFDRYATNLLARGLEIEPGAAPTYQLVTAFEVFEHLVDPVAGLDEMRRFAPSVLFSTMLMPRSMPLPGDWWYFALSTGQHVGIHTRRSLEVLGERRGLRLYSNGSTLHLLTDRKLSQSAFRLLARARVARVMNLFSRRASLTEADYAAVVGGSKQLVSGR